MTLPSPLETASLDDKRVVLGITGGIAAYKACEIVRRLRDLGIEVRVAMTPAAAQFVGPLTFAALSGNPVATSLFDESAPEEIPHVRWAEWADLLCVAPASADFLAKMAHGLADDFPSTLYLANAAPTIVAPAMEDDMYRHPAVQRNLVTLAADGVEIVGPASGALASGRQGPGRMSEPDDIVAAIVRRLRHGEVPRDLEGQRIVITAGPTYEALDPVRGFTNRSSGRMGYALATEAVRRGAAVALISGPTGLAAPAGVEMREVRSAAEMDEAVTADLPAADVAVFCAAVCDFTPAEPHKQKLKKGAENELQVVLKRTTDILARVGEMPERPFLIGFAAETESLEERAADKMARKGCDMLVANQIGGADDPMGGDSNAVIVFDRAGGKTDLPRADKAVVATQIWNLVATARESLAES